MAAVAVVTVKVGGPIAKGIWNKLFGKKEAGTLVRVAEDEFHYLINGKKAGNIVYKEMGDGEVWVGTYVEEGFQGRGISTKMMGQTVERLEAQGTQVNALSGHLTQDNWKAYIESEGI